MDQLLEEKLATTSMSMAPIMRLEGQQFREYRLVRLLGRGSHAEVYLGRHIHMNRPAAIKVFPIEGDSEGFIREARSIAQLEHPHIVRIYDFWIDEEQHLAFLVMNYAAYGALRQQHASGTLLPLDVILAYVKQVGSALQYAHEKGIVHRDVKPENILVEQSENILLSDFSIAMIARSTSSSIQDQAGTAPYMAPEQIRGHPRRASDQYALAVAVYEWLSGAPPFLGNVVQVVTQHLTRNPSPLCARIPGLLPGVEEVIFRALDKDPTARFPRVQDFVEALGAVGEHHPPLPGRIQPVLTNPIIIGSPLYPAGGSTEFPIPSTIAVQTPRPGPSAVPETPAAIPPSPLVPVPQPRSQIITSRRVVLASALAALAAGAGLVAWTVTHSSSQSPPPLAHTSTRTPSVPSPSPSSSPSPRSLLTYTAHSGQVQGIAWSPDGNSIASAGADQTVQIWNPTNGTTLQVCRGHSALVYRVAWSPDGTRIASSSQDGTVKIWDVSTGKNVATYIGHQSHVVYNLDWSSKTDLIASCGSDGTIQVWNPNTYATTIALPRLIFQLTPVVSVWGVSWSPDGKRIVSSCEGTSDNIQVWDATQQSGVPITSPVFFCNGHTNTVWKVAWSPDGKLIASASADSTSRLWNGATGAPGLSYQGANRPSDSIWYIAWSPSGNYLASSYKTGNVQIWGVDTANKVTEYDEPTNIPGDHRVVCSVWKPHGTQVASSSFDGTVRIWESGLR